MHMQLAVLLLLSLISTSLSKKIVLIPRASPDDTILEGVADGSSLTIECAVKSDKSPMWLYNGKEMQVVVERVSRIHFKDFNPEIHSGYYECVEPDTLESASVRIEQRDATLPNGFVRCTDESPAFCSYKGQCGVSLGNPEEKICSCYRGWHGKYCDRLNPLYKRSF